MNKKYLLLSVLSFLITGWFTASFSPTRVPLILTLVPAIGIGVTSYFFIRAFTGQNKTVGKLRFSIAKQLPIIVAVTLVLILILSSLGQLSIGSGLLVLAFIGLASFFVNRSTS